MEKSQVSGESRTLEILWDLQRCPLSFKSEGVEGLRGGVQAKDYPNPHIPVSGERGREEGIGSLGYLSQE